MKYEYEQASALCAVYRVLCMCIYSVRIKLHNANK